MKPIQLSTFDSTPKGFKQRIVFGIEQTFSGIGCSIPRGLRDKPLLSWHSFGIGTEKPALILTLPTTLTTTTLKIQF